MDKTTNGSGSLSSVESILEDLLQVPHDLLFVSAKHNKSPQTDTNEILLTNGDYLLCSSGN